MIFVILGTQRFQLNRLLQLLDRHAENGAIPDEIIAQTGASDYVPQHYRRQPFFTGDEFEAHVARADLVIAHGGVGAIMTAFRNQKPVIIFPRLAKYQEHVDDHQTEIARAFSEKGHALYCGETDDLPQLVGRARTHSFCPYVSQTDRIVGYIENFLKDRS